MKIKPLRSCSAFFVAASLLFVTSVRADPRIEDVFQSTQDAMGSDIDSRKVIAIVCAVVGLIVVIALAAKFKSRQASPRLLNHQGKLMRELQKELSLKPAEIRQLKAFVEGSAAVNPLTLMLCPSLLSRAAKEQPANVDRRALASIAKRIGSAKTPPTPAVK